MFDWQDIFCVVTIITSCIYSARKIDGFPDDMWARFMYGFHLATIIALFTCIAATKLDSSISLFTVNMPKVAYGVILVLGVSWLVGTAIEASLTKIKVKDRKITFYALTIGEFALDFFILVHILVIT